jgi:hypothetical protein
MRKERSVAYTRFFLLPPSLSTCRLHALPLSFDHKPEEARERERVEAAGGTIKAVNFQEEEDSAPVVIHRYEGAVRGYGRHQGPLLLSLPLGPV